MRIHHPERLTWAEMKAKYPNQWVLVVEAEEGPSPTIRSGVVHYADASKRTVFDEAIADAPQPPNFILYTGTLEHQTHEWRLVSILPETDRKI